MDKYLNDYLFFIKSCINETLGFESNTTLNQSIKFWINKNDERLKQKVLDDATKNFIEMGRISENENELELVNKTAYFFTSLFVNDWSENTINIFLEQFKLIKSYEVESIENCSENKVTLQFGDKQITKSFSDDLDDSTELIENIIMDTIEDFGNILSNEQRLALLVKIMKKYI